MLTRNVLLVQIFLAVILFFPQPGFAENSVDLPHDGQVRFFMYHSGESLDITYLNEKGEWIDEAYKQIMHLMRSRVDDLEIQMDKRLIELADHLQDHFQADTIEVISAYRSPELNNKLKREGHGVARESYHTKGMALDIHIDEVREDVLRHYLLIQQLGGVGYYGDRLMIHMDFGPVRQWQAGTFREKTDVGVFSNLSLSMRTDKFYYEPSDEQQMTVEGDLSLLKESRIVLQKFVFGKWQSFPEVLFVMSSPRAGVTTTLQKQLVLETVMQPLKNVSSYGKFRWRFEKGDEWQTSNEFYIKQI